MSFPISPTDGQIHNNYIWQSDSWVSKIDYKPTTGTNMGSLIILDHNNRPEAATIQVTVGSTPQEYDFSQYIPAGAKGVLLNARPTGTYQSESIGLMMWPADEVIVDWTDADIFLWISGLSAINTGNKNIHFDSLITRVDTDRKIKYMMGSTLSTVGYNVDCSIQLRGYYI